MIPAAQVARITRALPFWLSLGLFPLIAFVAGQGGLVADPDATLDMVAVHRARRRAGAGVGECRPRDARG